MAKIDKNIEPKPIDEWGTKEWEAAYSELNKKFDKLKNSMRLALNLLQKASQHLSEAVL